MKVYSLLLSVLVCGAGGQYQFGVICYSSSRFATGPNNSHKLVYRSELLDPAVDTVTLIFQSAESIYYTLSGNGSSQPWSQPVALYRGSDPAVSGDRDGDRHLVWVMVDSVSERFNIFYRNLEYRMMPVNVSTSIFDCAHPDVYADSTGVAHIVWEEGVDHSQIWYRTANETGIIGNRVRVSDDSVAECRFPAIECFRDTITVIWQQYNPEQISQYKIVKRKYANGIWLPTQVLMEGSEPVLHPSLDFACPSEGFSGAWEVCSGGNYEVCFAGGNGGGYHTSGMSMVPVVTTMETIWSYLFWEEDSAGYKDIFTHFYYFLTGWTRGSVRRDFVINEPVYAPNCLGALLVWTQGDTAPYKVMWGFFDYPIAIREATNLTPQGSIKSIIVKGEVNPSRWYTHSGACLFDITGRKVWEFTSQVNHLGRLRQGIYFVKSEEGRHRLILLR